MGAICQVYEQTEGGVKVIAEIQGGKVTGEQAASIRIILEKYGFPSAPIEDVIDEFLISSPGLGVAVVYEADGDGPP